MHLSNTTKTHQLTDQPFLFSTSYLEETGLCSPPVSTPSPKLDTSLIQTSLDNMSAPSIATKVDILRLITTLLSYDEFAHFSKIVPAVVKSWDARFLGLKAGVLIFTIPT